MAAADDDDAGAGVVGGSWWFSGIDAFLRPSAHLVDIFRLGGETGALKLDRTGMSLRVSSLVGLKLRSIVYLEPWESRAETDLPMYWV